MPGAPAAAWLFATLYFPALQLLPLYLFRGKPRSDTIYQRIAATASASACAGWLPTASRLASAAGAAQGPPSLLPALGIKPTGLAAACALPLLLTAILFAGPLLALLLSRHGRRGGGAHGSHVGHAGGIAWQQRISCMPVAARVRDWACSPLLEEFLFRGCLISYLRASGAGAPACALLSPLLFAACHLHHAYDLVRFQHVALGAAARLVAVQFAYTALFGQLAAFYFLRSGHLAAAVLPHAMCNVVGPPVLPPPGSPHRRAVLAALPAGVAAFFLLLRPLTEPRLFGNG